ncbi:MAG: prenyltransferase/squalene oxidase repeat-containing protein [Candidatus Thorarchaeota archaeon]
MKKAQIVGLMIILTLTLMAFNVDTVTANPGTRRDSLDIYMEDHFDSIEGGYTIPDAGSSRLYPTYAATVILDDQGKLDERPPTVDILRLKNFTRKLQWKSGGDDYDRWGAFSIYIAGPVSVQNTYLGIQMWEILNAQTEIPGVEDVKLNLTSSLVYINKTQSVDGGFGIHEDQAPDMMSTFYALYVLTSVIDLLQEQSVEAEQVLDDWFWSRTATIDWILSCREGDAFKLNPNSDRTSLSATAAALLALNEINALTSITDLQAIQNWIVDRQITSSEDGQFIGGFEEGFSTEDTNLVSTYHAIQALDAIEGINSINKTAAARFIVDCQAADGSWGTVPGLATGQMYYAGIAVISLRLLDEAGTFIDLLLEEDPNNPSPFFIDWRVLFVVSFIVVAALIAVIALRMD